MVVALSSAEAAAYATMNFYLAQQIQSQKGEANALLNRVMELMVQSRDGADGAPQETLLLGLHLRCGRCSCFGQVVAPAVRASRPSHCATSQPSGNRFNIKVSILGSAKRMHLNSPIHFVDLCFAQNVLPTVASTRFTTYLTRLLFRAHSAAAARKR